MICNSMICRHKLYHFTVANTRFTAPLMLRGKTNFATIKLYTLCQQIMQSQTCCRRNDYDVHTELGAQTDRGMSISVRNTSESVMSIFNLTTTERHDVHTELGARQIEAMSISVRNTSESVMCTIWPRRNDTMFIQNWAPDRSRYVQN